MIFNDCQTDFSRIERSGDDHDRGIDATAVESVVGGITTASSGAAAGGTAGTSKGPTQRHGKLFWQSYPAGSFVERLDWVADVFCGFRGVGCTYTDLYNIT